MLGGRYAAHWLTTSGPIRWKSSLAIPVASEVSRTRSPGSSTCTGSDTFNPKNSFPVSRSGEVFRLAGTEAISGASARPS